MKTTIYRKANSELSILKKVISFKDKTIIDAGCGTGNIVKYLNDKGADAYGIDTPRFIRIAKSKYPEISNNFIGGKAEKLPFKNSFADAVIFLASLHHIPIYQHKKVFKEALRVLKNGGLLIIIEPAAEKGHYYELTRLDTDESKILYNTYRSIIRNSKTDFKMISEKHYYLNRNYNEFVNLINTFVKGKRKRKVILQKADLIISETKKSGMKQLKTLFRSTIRVNTLRPLQQKNS